MANKLSEAYKDIPLQLQHIIPLDFKSIRELPESHSWTQTDSFSSEKRACDDNKYCVPVIDLTSPNVVELVGDACKKWGIFQVTNHGVPMSLIGHVESQTRRLFALPTEEKLKAMRSPGGATGYGRARISQFFSKFMWHEGFTIIGSSVEHAKELWPQDHAEFCDAMDNYQNNMKSLSHKILLLILKALGVEDHGGDQEMVCFFNQSECPLQLNSYPCCPDASRAIGLAPHTDSLVLTIVNQNDTNGLQIFQDNIGWTLVPPVPGALVVNVGDLLHIMSNARFPSAYHRVVPNETTHRFTMAYFYSPRGDSIIAPLPNLGPPVYRSLTAKEYLGLKSKHLNDALSLLRI